MTTNTDLSSGMSKATQIIQNAGGESTWLTEEQYKRSQAELRKLGINVITSINPSEGDDGGEQLPPTDEDGRTIAEISVYPVVVQIADENGNAVNGCCSTAFKGPYSDRFGNSHEGYPDAMFRKGWSVTLWARYDDDDDDEVYPADDEDFPDRDTAILRAEQLAALYQIEIDHHY